MLQQTKKKKFYKDFDQINFYGQLRKSFFSLKFLASKVSKAIKINILVKYTRNYFLFLLEYLEIFLYLSL